MPKVLDPDAPAIQGDRKRGPASLADRVRPGFTRVDLARMFRDLGFQSGAEIGVADGRYSTVLCEEIPGLRLLCVDPWMPYRGNTRGGPAEQHSGNYELAQQRLAAYNATLIRNFSVAAAQDVELESLDFVFIDANHSFDFVMEDLITWSRRVRSGGIVAGHDCYHFRDAGVVEAVTAYTAWHGIEWEICDEREPAFFWVKR